MRIVILTKYFGKNYTGATVATHTLIHKWLEFNKVESVIVITKNILEYDHHEKLHLIEYDKRHLKDLIEYYKSDHTIFYSDDHLGYLFGKRIKYIHTYHGNWPDARKLNIEYFLKSFYFIPCYKKTIKRAGMVVNVSKYMESFTKKINNKSCIIRNGAGNCKITSLSEKDKKNNNCIMIGNIDKRKYGKLIDLLNKLNKMGRNIQIDIFGNISDLKLAEKLKTFNNVKINGFVEFKKIPIENYKLMIFTSTIENLPISIVEVLKKGIPVISFKIGGIPEVINPCCGQTFEISDISKMAQAIRDSCDGKIKYSMVNEELKQFDWDVAAKQYIKLFKNQMKNNI